MEPIKFRETQYNQLLKIIDFPSIYIWGPECTGKTLVISSILENLCKTSLQVNCVELYTPELIFSQIITEIHETILGNAEDEFNNQKIGNNISLFISLLTEILNKIKEEDPTFTLHMIFKNASRLLRLDSNLLPFLLLLPEKTNNIVKILFIDRHPYDHLLTNLSTHPELYSKRPLCYHFPNYTKIQFIKLLTEFLESNPAQYKDQIQPDENAEYANFETEKDLETWESIQNDVVENYCKCIVESCSKVVKNYREMVQLAKDNWGKWLELRDDCGSDMMILIWRKFSLHMSDIFDPDNAANSQTKTTINGARTQTGKVADIQLPYYAKYLLIAAYIASFNHQKTDSQIFVYDNGKQTKRQKSILKNKKINPDQMLHILGPKYFTRERWFNMFEALLEKSFSSSIHLEAVVQNLCEMDLIIPGKIDVLSCVPDKYQVNVNLDMISQVARSVGVDLRGYLVDLQDK